MTNNAKPQSIERIARILVTYTFDTEEGPLTDSELSGCIKHDLILRHNSELKGYTLIEIEPPDHELCPDDGPCRTIPYTGHTTTF